MRSSLLSVISFSVAVFISASILQSQSSSQDQKVYQSDTTLRANTRLVVVDVVATDKEGRPVAGLKQDEFNVSEEREPQKISNFTAHIAVPTTVAPRKLPPNVVSNNPEFQASSLNVILFDAVNGDFQAHSYAKQELLKFLQTAQVERPIAIFALQTQLQMLHDFTTDTPALRASVEKYKFPAEAPTTQSWESRVSAFSTRSDFHSNDRTIRTTLNQLNVLAKVLGGYPGRKNLIWLSESFPIDLFPDVMTQTSIGVQDLKSNQDGQTNGGPSGKSLAQNSMDFKDYAALIKKVSDELMKSQVAVYPVDAGALGRNDHLAAQQTMLDIAARTGGRAFINRNDLAQSMGTSLDDGSTYYTLEYYPTNKNWNGQFRAIQVKTTRPGVTLRFREGYYATDPEKNRKEEMERVAEDYSRLLEVDAPAVTGILFQAGIVPPSDKNGKLVVNFAIDPHTIAFENKNGVEHAEVDCTLWAYKGNDKQKPIMAKGNVIAAAVTPEVHEKIMKTYFPCKRELELKPGVYTLKLGVIDRKTNQMGTSTASVTVQ